jgi:hypothetical protein
MEWIYTDSSAGAPVGPRRDRKNGGEAARSPPGGAGMESWVHPMRDAAIAFLGGDLTGRFLIARGRPEREFFGASPENSLGMPAAPQTGQLTSSASMPLRYRLMVDCEMSKVAASNACTPPAMPKPHMLGAQHRRRLTRGVEFPAAARPEVRGEGRRRLRPLLAHLSTLRLHTYPDEATSPLAHL